MELKALILGLVFSMGIFAVKSGAGLFYLVQKTGGMARRLWVLVGFAAGYALVFGLAWLVVSRIDPLAHLDTVMLLFKNGMTLHMLLAVLLLLWGAALLKKRVAPQEQSRGWLLLALPCPICFSVILFAGSFLHNLLPDVHGLFVWLFAGFTILSLLSALGFTMFGKENAEHGLGRVMVLAALYFLVTITVVPQFTDLERIYRVSKSTVIVVDQHLPLFLAVMFLVFITTFLTTFRRIS
jgi:predicted transporter